MAIKIIKEGKITKFTKTCPDCECEFEYEQEDIKVDHSVCLTSYPGKYGTYVICPCCGKHLNHGYVTTTAISSYPNISDTTTEIGFKYLGFKDLDCDNCPCKPNLLEYPVAGDRPCDWCIKRQFTLKK